MIADVNFKKQNAIAPEPQQEFNYRHCWYAICFVQDLPVNRPYSFSLYDEPFVAFRNRDGKIVCLIDRCPHRAAKLSDGQIIDGKIECLYHGWQFGSDGECLHIPQLPAGGKIPRNACIQSFPIVERQGIIWMWAGVAAADEKRIPTITDLDRPSFVSADVMRDLPYDHNSFIENVLDPAHVQISHDGTQGNRENAQPLEMEVIATSERGIQGRFRETHKSNQPWRTVDFVAPGFVIYRFSIEQKGWSGGLALYSIPLGKGRCRLLARNYRNFLTLPVKLKPRWLDHMFRNKILDEDLPLIVGAEKEIERLGHDLKQVYFPLKTCDTFVLEYRKWLDKFGSSLPYYQGYSTSKNIGSGENSCQSSPLDRFSQHTQICSSCNRAYQVTNQLKQILIGVAIALAALAIVTESDTKIVAVSASLLAVVLATMAQKVKTQFERSYTRH